jgi:hypothetical protein
MQRRITALFYLNLPIWGANDRWVHLVVENTSTKNYSNTVDAVEKISESWSNLIQSNVNYYSDLAETVSKEGYSGEAERYRLISRIYNAILKKDLARHSVKL